MTALQVLWVRCEARRITCGLKAHRPVVAMVKRDRDEESDAVLAAQQLEAAAESDGDASRKAKVLACRFMSTDGAASAAGAIIFHWRCRTYGLCPMASH